MGEDIRNGEWDLQTGHLYRIGSRNLPYGVYDGKGGFTGIREKLGLMYLFTEYDWDSGPPFGTVIVKEDLGPVPAELDFVCGWFLPEDHPGGSGYKHNTALYDYLAEAEKRHGRGTGYGSRPGDDDEEKGKEWQSKE